MTSYRSQGIHNMSQHYRTGSSPTITTTTTLLNKSTITQTSMQIFVCISCVIDVIVTTTNIIVSQAFIQITKAFSLDAQMHKGQGHTVHTIVCRR